VSKQGKPYEEAVAAVLQAFDRSAKISQGKWVIGPDGRRELDVTVEGLLNGQPRSMLVECKDFNPRTTGPVGIAYLDALDSKRRDLNMDFALLCSNAGFTVDAIRKAKRVNIGLASIIRKGDPRVRFTVKDETYLRNVRVESISVTLHGDAPIELSSVPFYDIQWNDIPIANWVHHRVAILVSSNPIVTGTFTATHQLVSPQLFRWGSGEALATHLDFTFKISGRWLSHPVQFESTNAIYDWLRRRLRVAPGGGHVSLGMINYKECKEIDRPPDREFVRERFLQGDIEMRVVVFDLGFGGRKPVPQFEPFVAPADLSLSIAGLTKEVTTTTSHGARSA